MSVRLVVQEYLYGIGGREEVELIVWDAVNHIQLTRLKASYTVFRYGRKKKRSFYETPCKLTSNSKHQCEQKSK